MRYPQLLARGAVVARRHVAERIVSGPGYPAGREIDDFEPELIGRARLNDASTHVVHVGGEPAPGKPAKAARCCMATVDADRSLALQMLDLAAGIVQFNPLILQKLIRNNHLSPSEHACGVPPCRRRALSGTLPQTFPRLVPDRHLSGGVGGRAHLLPADKPEHGQSTPPAARGSVTGETVDRSEKARGYEVGESTFLPVEDEELEGAPGGTGEATGCGDGSTARPGAGGRGTRYGAGSPRRAHCPASAFARTRASPGRGREHAHHRH